MMLQVSTMTLAVTFPRVIRTAAIMLFCLMCPSREIGAQSPQFERHGLDLDGDHVTDSLILMPAHHADGPGQYARLQLILSRSGPRTATGREDISCCLQALHIYGITPRGIVRYFERAEFEFTSPLRVGAESIEGVTWTAEVTGTSAKGAKQASSYQPITVIRLEEHPRIDTSASARRTREVRGGFAGLQPRESIRMIVGNDGSRYLWDEVRMQRVP